MKRFFSDWQLMISLLFLGATSILSFKKPTDLYSTFSSLEQGIVNSEYFIDDINSQIMLSIDKSVNAYRNSIPIGYQQQAIAAMNLSRNFSNYIDSIILVIQDDPYTNESKQSKYLKNKIDRDTVMNLLKYGSSKSQIFYNKGIGDILNEVKVGLISLCGSDQLTVKTINAIFYETYGGKFDKASIGKAFEQLSNTNICTILRKYKLDIKASVYEVLIYLNSKIGGLPCFYSIYNMALSPQMNYVDDGETFKADLFLSSFIGIPPMGSTLSINNMGLNLIDGVARYTDVPKDYGTHILDLRATTINPYSAKHEEVKKIFSYEVLDRSISICSDKVKILYIGIDNPISVSLPGVKAGDLTVQISGYGKGSLMKVSNANYIIRVKEETKPGQFCVINLKAKGVSKRIRFIVKRIPDPVLHIDKAQNDEIDGDNYKTHTMQLTNINNHELAIQCTLKGFTLVRVSNSHIIEREVNSGSSYNQKCQNLIANSKIGDTYYYNNIRVNCPGDKIDRILNPVVLTIK